MLLQHLLLFVFLYNNQAFGQGLFRVKPQTKHFADGYQEGELASADEDIRLWHKPTQVEVLRKLAGEVKGQGGPELNQRISAARNLLLEQTEKGIVELCATSSSVTCALANDLLKPNVEASDDMWERCQARKEFLACIEAEREKCKNLAERGYFPELPPQAKVKSIQENAWKRLWTSGACVLQA